MPGVITTSTSSKIDSTRARIRSSAASVAAIRRSENSRAEPHDLAGSRLRPLRRRHQRHVVADPAQVTRQNVRQRRGDRVVGVAHTTSWPSSRSSTPASRTAPLLLPDRGDQRWRNLGAQRDSQPARRSRRGGDEPAGRRRHRGGDVQEQRRVGATRAIGPLTDRPFHAPSCGASGTRSRWGLMPKSPHHVDGMRMEPPPSEPSATAARPAATAAADPPLLPPGVRPTSHGFRVAPNVSDSVNGQMHISGTMVLPRITAPAARSRRTTSAS